MRPCAVPPVTWAPLFQLTRPRGALPTERAHLAYPQLRRQNAATHSGLAFFLWVLPGLAVPGGVINLGAFVAGVDAPFCSFRAMRPRLTSPGGVRYFRIPCISWGISHAFSSSGAWRFWRVSIPGEPVFLGVFSRISICVSLCVKFCVFYALRNVLSNVAFWVRAHTDFSTGLISGGYGARAV